jgi:hypothetical protein
MSRRLNNTFNREGSLATSLHRSKDLLRYPKIKDIHSPRRRNNGLNTNSIRSSIRHSNTSSNRSSSSTRTISSNLR